MLLNTLPNQLVRDQVTTSGAVEVRYCKTEDMIADMLIKGLYSERFAKLRGMANIKEMDKQ